MSVVPFPPIVHGPVYPVTPVLHLTGVWLGWNVSVVGSASGKLAEVLYTQQDTPNIDQWITLSTLPRQGEFIIVEQHSIDAGHSVSSGPSPDKAAQVLPLPSPELPRLIITSPPHTCSEGIGIEGIIPGAWVNVEIDGGPSLVHKQARRGTADTFPLDLNGPLPEGKLLNVWQEIRQGDILLESPKTTTGPVENLKLTNPLRKITYCNQPASCYNDVCLNNMLPDARVLVDAPDGPQRFAAIVHSEQWDFQGWFPHPIGGGPPGVVTSVQQFPRCQLTSDKSISAPITRTVRYPVPKLEVPICDDQDKIFLSDLVPGAQLKVSRFVGDRLADTRYAVIPQSTWAFTLPKDLPLTDPHGAVKFAFSQQGTGSCALTDVASNPATVVATTLSPGTAPSPIKLSPAPALVCSRTLNLAGLTTGAEVAIFRTDGFMVVGWMPVKDSTMFVTLPHRISPLPQGVLIYAEQRGCKANVRSNPVKVEKLARDHLPPPELSVLPRPGDKSVTAKGLVVGGRAYVMVEGSRYSPSGVLWSQETDIVADNQVIALQVPLPLGVHVLVVQNLCGSSDSSPTNLPGTLVDKFTIILSADTRGAVTKGQQNPITIHCKDRDSASVDKPDWGLLSYNTHLDPCGTSRNDFFPANDPRTALVVKLPESDRVHAAELSIPLANAPPPPPPQQDIVLKFTAGPSYFSTQLYPVTVSNVNWNAKPTWGGAAVNVPNTLSNGVFRGSHTFTVPGNVAHPVVQVTGSATFSDATGSQQFGLVGQVELGPNACIGWNLAFDWTSTGVPGQVTPKWANGQVGIGPVTPGGFSC